MISIDHIAKTYSPEIALLVLVCRVEQKTNANESLTTYIAKNPIDWKLFANIVAAHQLRPVVYKVLSELAADVDAGFMSKLRIESLRIASGNLVKLDVLTKLHTALNEYGVVNIPYKGVLLSHLIYHDFVSRETADIDFLINPNDFSLANQVLLDNGYNPQYFFRPDLEKRFVEVESEMLFLKDTHNIPLKVEIHWDVTHRMMNVPIDFRQLFDNSEINQVLDKQVRMLAAEDLLVVLLIHHGVNDVWRSLRHVVDLAALLNNDASLLNPEVEERLRQTGLLKTSAIGTQLCYDLFGVGATSPISQTNSYRSVLHNLLTFPALKKQKLSVENIRQQFLLRDNFKDQLLLAFSYARAAFTPNLRDVETLALPRRLYFLYYLLKPFLLFARRR
ncbi:MAG: hypothetical protein K0R82_2835 [Flavipsychrobacter sp.]|nr:hypothetical protein [Flavipsychrobacter sp.]